jgi:hypothetical protein
MKKFIAGTLAGMAVLALTLITLLLDPTTFLQPRWKLTSIAIAVFAILCMLAQGIWTKQDEDAEKRRAKEDADARDRQAQQLFDLLDKILMAVVNQQRRTPTSRTYTAAANAMLILNGLRESNPESDRIPALWLAPRMGPMGPEPEEVSDQTPTPTVSRKEALEQLEQTMMVAVNVSQDTTSAG